MGQSKPRISIVLDPNLNKDNSIPTDNGDIDQMNRSPDSPNQSSFPQEQQQQPENEHQRQTIIPIVHLDSLLNHNHNDFDEDSNYSHHIFFQILSFAYSRSAKSFTNR